MMYSTTAIDALTARHAWAAPMQPTSKVLTSANGVGTSGRLFDSFHAMCIVENVEECMPVSNALTASETITNTVLNDFLTKLRRQAALKVLSRVFDSNDAANFRVTACGNRVDLSATDYSATIISRASAFDNALGYQVAYDVLELMLTTSRSNMRERVAAESSKLRVELQGWRDENGNLKVDGVFQKLEDAFVRINAALFTPTPTGPRIRNVSHLW